MPVPSIPRPGSLGSPATSTRVGRRVLGRAVSAHRSEGQALPLFALGLIVFLGFVAMSIDVGRYVWARTQMQAAVDAAALAGAQSMPNTAAADSYAQSYWLDNSGFIQSQGSNVQFAVTYPAGGVKAVHVHGEANISTWFARLFGHCRLQRTLDQGHGRATNDVMRYRDERDLAVLEPIDASRLEDPVQNLRKATPSQDPSKRKSRVPKIATPEFFQLLSNLCAFKATTPQCADKRPCRNSHDATWAQLHGFQRLHQS